MSNRSIFPSTNQPSEAHTGPSCAGDKEIQPWEKRCHAFIDVLDGKKIIDRHDFNLIVNAEEKRNVVEREGIEPTTQLSYYERWVVAAHEILIQKQILSSEEVGRKAEEIRSRLRADLTRGSALT